MKKPKASLANFKALTKRKLNYCKLCKGFGLLDGLRCDDCDGSGFVEVGSDVHAQQLKLDQNKFFIRRKPK